MSSLSTSEATKVNFYSGYNIDKIVRVDEGSFDASAATTIGGFLKQHSIAHGYSRPLFTDLLWSTDNSTWIDGGTGQAAGTHDSSISYSDSTNNYILTTKTTGTIYYKVIGYWITDYDGTDPSVADYDTPNNTIQFDSRVNYQKIFNQDVEDISRGGTSVVAHNLLYYPNFRVYIEAFSGEVWNMNFGGASNPFLYDLANQAEAEAFVDTTSMTLKFSSGGTWGGTRKMWHKIYYDSEKL